MQGFEHLPSDCPPEEAREASNDLVYRFVTTNPPTQQDFLSWRELNPQLPCPEKLTECQARGISVYTSKTDVDRLKRKIPVFRDKILALGNLNSQLGMIQNTPSKNAKSHHTWWFPFDSEPWTIFQVLDLTNGVQL